MAERTPGVDAVIWEQQKEQSSDGRNLSTGRNRLNTLGGLDFLVRHKENYPKVLYEDNMQEVRKSLGGIGNMMFLKAFVMGKYFDNEIPDFYVQGEKYWAEHAKQIKDFFSQGIGFTDAVALHIRRGDYLQAESFHNNLSKTNYYRDAVKLFPDDRFIVFCKDNQGWEQDKQDRAWCMEYLEPLLGKYGERWQFSQFSNTEVEDMNLMASCKSVIGANSSFSFWAAYLGDHSKEAIIMPKEDTWFTDGIVRVELPSHWTKL